MEDQTLLAVIFEYMASEEKENEMLEITKEEGGIWEGIISSTIEMDWPISAGMRKGEVNITVAKSILDLNIG